MKILKTLLVTAAVSVALIANTAQAETKKIALVVKALGIGFFEAANKGAQEAAKELGGALTVRSDGPGKGATFILSLPLTPELQPS